MEVARLVGVTGPTVYVVKKRLEDLVDFESKFGSEMFLISVLLRGIY